MPSASPTVADLRLLVSDPATAPSPYNLARGESLQLPEGAAVATCTVFYLANAPIVASSVYLTTGTTFRTQSGFTVDTNNAILTFSVAPGASGSLPNPFVVDYNFNWFTDADYIAFIGRSLELLGFAANISGTTTTTVLDTGLFPAVYELAKSWFYGRRATQYAEKYSASGGGQGQQVESVCKHFQDLEKVSYAEGIKKRDDFYKRQGQREAPSSHAVNYGISPIHGAF